MKFIPESTATSLYDRLESEPSEIQEILKAHAEAFETLLKNSDPNASVKVETADE